MGQYIARIIWPLVSASGWFGAQNVRHERLTNLRIEGTSEDSFDTEGQQVATTSHSTSPLAKVVFSTQLINLPYTVVDPDKLATPGRLRLLDVAAFLDREELRIVEYLIPGLQDPLADISQTPVPPYAAISYPWRDLQLPAGQSVPSFSVAGAEHADPISIDVIRTACVAARAYGCEMFWLDRLCILQNHKQDKIWQIRRMFRIYKYSAVCLVFPGGLVRLARLDDSTTWIHRAWTLQEAVAPGKDKLKLVYQPTHSSHYAFIQYRCDTEGYVTPLRSRYLLPDGRTNPKHEWFLDKVLEEGRSVSCQLERLLFSIQLMEHGVRYHTPEIAHDPSKLPVRILPAAEACYLDRALDFGGMLLWTSSYTRSSSRPVDMVFSIMDLMGVQVDVAKYGENERTRATIAMIQALMMRSRARATWLFIGPAMTPSRELSTLPEMPETSESGRAYVRTSMGRVPASEAINVGGYNNFWRSDGAPIGEMTDSGYFTFWAKGALMVSCEEETDRLVGWKAYDNRETWAVIVGRFENLNRNPDTFKIQSSRPETIPQGLYELTLMLIEKHADDLYHRVGMEREVDERKTVEWNWSYRRFHVGGPGRGERKRFGVSPSGPVYTTQRPDEEVDQFLLWID